MKPGALTEGLRINVDTEQYVWLSEKVIWTSTCIKKSKNMKYFYPNAEEEIFKSSDTVICVTNSNI